MIKRLEVSWRKGEETGIIPVEIIRSARKSLGLEIQAGNGVCANVYARVPNRIPDAVIFDFVTKRQEWIVEKWFDVRERQEKLQARQPRDYELDPELEKRYRKLAREKLRERADYYSEIMGVTYNRLAIGAAKTRWGSCSSKGNLNFHWKLILMPKEILDYVVVHELAHRKEMNHSPHFWALVEEALPDYKVRRKWLKEHGSGV